MGVEEWGTFVLGDLCQITSSKRIFAEEYVDVGIPFYRSKEVIEKALGEDITLDLFIPNERFHEIKRNFGAPQKGDILISSVGNRSGIPYLVKDDDGDFYFKDGNVIWFKDFNDKLNSKYLSYWLKSSLGQNALDSIMIGSAQKALTIIGISGLSITLPHISVQEQTANILSSLDNKIEVNRRMNATLESMARAVFCQWFVGSEEVGNWETAVLNDLAESILGGDWGKDTNEDGTLLPAFCIRGADIPDLQAGGTGKMPLRYIKPSSLEKRKLQAGDIVVEISGGSPTQSTGRPVFISDTLLNRLQHPLVASNFCRVFRPKDTIVSNFVYFWLRFLYSRDEFFQYENGTTGIKNFAFTIFCEQYYLSMPPKKMLEKYHQFTTTIFEAMQRNAKESRTLGSLRDSLLPKLMRGEVRVKDEEK